MPGLKWPGLAALLVAALSPGGFASAQESGGVRYTVSVGYASKEEGAIHPQFRGIPGPFKSVSMHQQSSYTLRLGERGRHSLPTGSEIHMVPEKVRDQRLHMQFEMPGVVNTRLRLRNGKRMIVGGVPFKDGHLIIQVRPEFPQRRALDERRSRRPVDPRR
ncbi:MAG: hypothetical protein J4G09_08650 [Proteobacteria bacterium]|nr:hypothetical protein [Pseudomonadota bacterium]